MFRSKLRTMVVTAGGRGAASASCNQRAAGAQRGLTSSPWLPAFLLCVFKAVGTVGGLRGSSVNRSCCRRAERTLTLWVHKVIHQLHGTDGNRGLFNPFKPGVGFSWHSIHCWQWPRWNCQYQRAKGFKCVTRRTNWGEWWLGGGGGIAQIRLSHFTAASRDRKMQLASSFIVRSPK